METKTCRKCLTPKPLGDFYDRSDRPGKKHSWCIDCKATYNSQDYKKLGNPSRVRERNAEKIERNQLFVAKYLSEHSCVDCGEDDITVLDFDHQENKEFNVPVLICMGYGLDTLKKEIAKCQVRCANCHRRKTHKERNTFKYLFRLRSMVRTSVSDTENVGSSPAVGATIKEIKMEAQPSAYLAHLFAEACRQTNTDEGHTLFTKWIALACILPPSHQENEDLKAEKKLLVGEMIRFCGSWYQTT